MLMKAQKLRVDDVRGSPALLVILSSLVGQSRVHLAVRDGRAREGGGAYQRAQWQGHKGRGERSRGGGPEREKPDQALEFQHRNSPFFRYRLWCWGQRDT